MYLLTFKMPHIYNDGFSGKGTEIGYVTEEKVINAKTDKEAIAEARTFLNTAARVVHNYRVYKRRGIRLTKIKHVTVKRY
mgnify:CR=1 FL=1